VPLQHSINLFCIPPSLSVRPKCFTDALTFSHAWLGDDSQITCSSVQILRAFAEKVPEPQMFLPSPEGFLRNGIYCQRRHYVMQQGLPGYTYSLVELQYVQQMQALWAQHTGTEF